MQRVYTAKFLESENCLLFKNNDGSRQARSNVRCIRTESNSNQHWPQCPHTKYSHGARTSNDVTCDRALDSCFIFKHYVTKTKTRIQCLKHTHTQSCSIKRKDFGFRADLHKLWKCGGAHHIVIPGLASFQNCPWLLISGRIKVKNNLTHIQTTTRTQTFGAINITSIRKALTSQAQWQVVYNHQRIWKYLSQAKEDSSGLPLLRPRQHSTS